MSSGSAQQNLQPFDIYNQPPTAAAGGQSQQSGPAKSMAPPGNRPNTQSPPQQSGPPTGQSPTGRLNPPSLPPRQQPPTQAPPQNQSSTPVQQSNNAHQQQPSQQAPPSQQQGSSDYSPGPPSANKTNKAPPTPTEIPLSAWRRGSSSNLRNSGSFSSASGMMPPVAPSGRYQGDSSTVSTPPTKASAPPANQPPTSTTPPVSTTPASQTQPPPQSVASQYTSTTKPSQQVTPHSQPQPNQNNAAQQSNPQVQSAPQAGKPVPQQGSAQAQPAPQQPVQQMQPTQSSSQPNSAQQSAPQTGKPLPPPPQSAPQKGTTSQSAAQPGPTTTQQQALPAAPQSNSTAQPAKSAPPPTRPTPTATTQPQAHQPPPASSPHRSPSREMHTPNQTPVRNQPAENSYLQPSSPNGGKRASNPWVTPSNDASNADNECTYVTMGSMAHHVIERLDNNNDDGDNHHQSSTQHYALVETSKMVDDMLIHQPEDLSKSGRCLHLHNPHHVTRRGEIIFAPSTGNTLESNTTPQTLTSWPIPPPTPGNYGRLQSIQGQLTLVGCHRYEPDVMEELAYVDRAVSEGPNRRGYFSVERTQEALYGRTKNAYPDSGNLKYNTSHFSPNRQQQMNHAPSLVGSAVERSSPFTPQRQMDSFLMSPNSERNPRPPVPQNTPAQYHSYDTTSTPTRQTANTDGPQLVSSRTERLDRPSVASPLLYRMESSPLHY